MSKTLPNQVVEWVEDVALKHEDHKSCLLWPFYRGSGGYGYICHKGTNVTAHRRVLELHTKQQGAVARHKCDNPPCVNPHHLEWGSYSQNSMDRLRSNTHDRGERNSQAKLTKTQVLEIRKSKLSQSALAAKYGVSRSCIRLVLNRTTWNWL